MLATVAFTSPSNGGLRHVSLDEEAGLNVCDFDRQNQKHVFKCSSGRCACLLWIPRPHSAGWPRSLFWSNKCCFEYQVRGHGFPAGAAQEGASISPHLAITAPLHYLLSCGANPAWQTFFPAAVPAVVIAHAPPRSNITRGEWRMLCGLLTTARGERAVRPANHSQQVHFTGDYVRAGHTTPISTF